MSIIYKENKNFICHYGMPRRSGRYPWGSGDRPYQGESTKNHKNITKYLEPNIKSGKDKENISPAEKTAKETGKIISDAQNIIREIKSIKKEKGINDTAKQMTDSELREAINRLNMEKQYSNLTSKDTSIGLDYISTILGIAGSIVAIGASSSAIASTIYTIKSK